MKRLGKTAALLMALMMLVSTGYAECMSCLTSSFAQTNEVAACCTTGSEINAGANFGESGNFLGAAGGEEDNCACCESSACDDVLMEEEALTVRADTDYTPAAIYAAEPYSYPAPASARLTSHGRPPPIPPKASPWLANCSFRC